MTSRTNSGPESPMASMRTAKVDSNPGCDEIVLMAVPASSRVTGHVTVMCARRLAASTVQVIDMLDAIHRLRCATSSRRPHVASAGFQLRP